MQHGCLEDLVRNWHRLDERVESLSAEINALAVQDAACQRLMTVPGIGPIISSAIYCWREAIKASGARWDQPGRRPAKNFLA